MIQNYVPPRGNFSARIMIVGEAPGEKENYARQPFIGPNGALLDEMLQGAGIPLGDIFYTNAFRKWPGWG